MDLRATDRRAMALPAVLLLVVVGLIIVLGIHNFSTETYRRTARGTYATMSEVLAESAHEEAWYLVQKDVNTPGTQLYQLFREENDFENFPIALPTLRTKIADPQFAGYMTDRYDAASSFQASVSMKWTNPYGGKMPGVTGRGEFDGETPWERVGIVTIRGSAQAKAASDGLANFRRMVVSRPFRLNKITPPVPFDRSGLIILYPEHMTDVVVAGVLDNPTAYAVQQAGKARLTPLLDRMNGFITEAGSKAKEMNDAYKLAEAPPNGGHITPPPRWLQDIIDRMGGLVSQATRLDLQGQGRRPFLFSDEVMIARSSMAGANLGPLAEFNYEKKMQEGLKPLNDLLKALSTIQEIVTAIINALKVPHQLVPYGATLEALVVPMYPIVPELVGSVKDICNGLHEKLMDPCLEVAIGVGQVIALAQKIVIEVPMMGQQAFAGFTNQITGAASGAVQSQIGQNLDLNNMGLQGLPTNTPAMGFSLNMPLPNYANQEEINDPAGLDAGEIVKSAGEGVLNLLLEMVKRELVTFITEQIAQVTAKIAISVPVTAAACAGPQAIFTCVPAKAALALAFDIITRTVMREITQKLNRIGGFKADAMGKIVQVITRRVPVFGGFLANLDVPVEDLLSKVLTAAFEKRDVSPEVDAWMQSLAQQMASKAQEAVSDGLGTDKLGGVLKGYVLRHRFRNLVEFDGSGSMGSGGQFQSGGVGADGLNAWRNAFDRVYKESLWRKKATWIVATKNHFEALLSRYFEGKYLVGNDPSGDGTNRWRDDSYAPNVGYGLSGVVIYDGTEDLTLDFTGARAFIGKCVLYVPKAKVIVTGCKMRDINKDSFTLICAKPVKLPPTDVEISVHAIGSGADCAVEMSEGTKILGSLILKRYTVQDQSNPKASLNGTLTFNEKLNGTGGGAIGGMKESHLFISISPYVISREMETQP